MPVVGVEKDQQMRKRSPHILSSKLQFNPQTQFGFPVALAVSPRMRLDYLLIFHQSIGLFVSLYLTS